MMPNCEPDTLKRGHRTARCPGFSRHERSETLKVDQTLNRRTKNSATVTTLGTESN
jgi:hypothetical protein